MSFVIRLTELLKTDPRFTDEVGDLLISAVRDCAWRIDHTLVRLLLSDEAVKDKFFDEIDGYWVFNTNTFIEYISQKDFLDNSYTRFRNKIGLTIGDEYISERGEVALAFPYKDCVLEGGQTKEEEKRKELFFNEVLAEDEINQLFSPKVLTNFKRYTVEGEQTVTDFKRDENGVIRENLIIKGNNLIALHTIKEQFRGQVKLIYIDPPYNTGNDTFGYNDNFNHSSWLTFMKNRLNVAKDLLAPSGVIIIHCDFVEDGYLRVLMDDIFGRENYINSIAIRDSHPSGLKLSAREKTIIKTKSTMHVYKKYGELHINPIYQRRYEWDTHFNSYIDVNSKQLLKVSLSDYVKENTIVKDPNFRLDEKALLNNDFKEFAFKNRHKIFQSTKEIPEYAKIESLKQKDVVIEYSSGEYAYNGRRLSPLSRSIYNVGFDGYEVEDFAKLLCDFWDDVDFNNLQNEGGVNFPSAKKPEILLARLITMFTSKGDIVLDYHLGSGTTSAVAHKMERQYIGIEQMQYGENDSVVRLKNVINGDKTGISKNIEWKGGGNFIFCDLVQYNQAFLASIQESNNTEQLLTIWQDIAANSFLKWYISPEIPEDAINDFIALSEEVDGLEKQKKLLIELLDKNQLYVNLSEIDDAQFNVSEEDKALNRAFYGEV
ncbi:MAG TPA: site-specific DNA-methyltransferase [Brevefilum sp.]|nr:site-specific DNA-methyltransferase [Brevefilum sp.]HPL69092.1 site-specific DNA-methyltransferase [Brevefilum sp.]